MWRTSNVFGHVVLHLVVLIQAVIEVAQYGSHLGSLCDRHRSAAAERRTPRRWFESSAQRAVLLPNQHITQPWAQLFRASVSLTACGWCAKPHTNSPMVRGLHKTRCRDQTQPKLTGVVHDFWSTRRETNGTGRKGEPAEDETGKLEKGPGMLTGPCAAVLCRRLATPQGSQVVHCRWHGVAG